MSLPPNELAAGALEHYLTTEGGAPEGDWALLDNLHPDELRELVKLALQRLRDPIKFGEHYRDTVTGYEGVATSKFIRFSGTATWGLERLGTDGKPMEVHFRPERLEPCPNSGAGFR